MTELYIFETSEFGISEKSIHLLRSRYCYKTIDFSNVDSMLIKKGMDMRNWLVVLILGLGMIMFALYDATNIYLFFNDGQSGTIELKRILVPLLPFFLGLYSLIVSLRKSFIMKMKSGRKKYHFSLRDIVKSNNYAEFLKSVKKLYPFIDIR